MYNHRLLFAATIVLCGLFFACSSPTEKSLSSSATNEVSDSPPQPQSESVHEIDVENQELDSANSLEANKSQEIEAVAARSNATAGTSTLKPGVSRQLIERVATSPGHSAAVYDLKFDYEMSQISDEDYRYLLQLNEHAKVADSIARRRLSYHNAYNVASGNGSAITIELDSNTILSTPLARLEALKSIIDDARNEANKNESD